MLLSPWFLLGLVAVGLPIWLHLLRQHKSQPLPFSSLMFFEKRTQSSIKHRRLKYRVLFAMRLAMVALLALLFAQPACKRAATAGGAGARHVVLAVDRSFSMRAGDGVAQAKNEAISTLSRVRPGDQGQVIALSGQAELLTQATGDAAELRAAIASIAPGDGRSSYAELSRSLRSIGDASKLPLEVHLFTDLQKTSAPAQFKDLALPAGAVFEVHAIGAAKQANWMVESVSAPRSMVDPKKVRIQATVAGTGGKGESKVAKTVSLVANGRVLETKTVEALPNGRTSLEFIGFDAPYGWNKGEVRVNGGDALPGDDTFRFAVERADPRRVLFLHEGGRGRAALYFRSALEAAADNVFAVEAVPVDQALGFPPEKFAYVVLSDTGNLPASVEDSLKKYVNAGGAVWIAGGSSLASRQTVPITGARIVESRYAARASERFFSAAGLDATHPSIKNANRLEGIRFYQALRIVPSARSRTVAKLNDDTPLLTETPVGQGRVIFFASTFDNIANDFPLHASFVPFVEQTSRYLGGGETRSAAATVDSFLELRAAGAKSGAKADGKAASTVEVLDPSGKRALDLKEATNAQAFRLTGEGFYELARENGRRELVAVNADRAEGVLEPMDAETVELWKNTGKAAPSADGTTNPLERIWNPWWYLALALLGLTLVQMFWESRHLDGESAAGAATTTTRREAA